MKLISEIINKKLTLSNEAELNSNYLLHAWHFYLAYSISLAITGFEDPKINQKNLLMSKLITKFSFNVYSQIKKLIKKDMEVINMAIDVLEYEREESNIFGDFYQTDMIGISVYDQ